MPGLLLLFRDKRAGTLRKIILTTYFLTSNFSIRNEVCKCLLWVDSGPLTSYQLKGLYRAESGQRISVSKLSQTGNLLRKTRQWVHVGNV